VTYTGPAELTFSDNESLLVDSNRVLIAMSDRGVGALRISPRIHPNIAELVAALQAGPFTLASHRGMMTCRLLSFMTREPPHGEWEMVIVFAAA
jgi:hypothetical protein